MVLLAQNLAGAVNIPVARIAKFSLSQMLLQSLSRDNMRGYFSLAFWSLGAAALLFRFSLTTTRGVSLMVCCTALLAVWDARAAQGSVLALDGVDDYASAPDSPSLDLGVVDGEGFTIETFFYVPNTNTAKLQALVTKNWAYQLAINFRTNQPDFIFLNLWSIPGDIGKHQLGVPAEISAGWHHIAVTFENTSTQDTAAIFLDGARLTFANNLGFLPGIYNSTLPVNVGAFAGAAPFEGWIDEMRFSSVVRYSGPSYVVPSGRFTLDANIRALWHFDEEANSTVFEDASGRGNDLTGLNGATASAGPSPELVAWGWSVYGQTTVPAGLSGVKAIAAGDTYTAALRNDGTVVVWGGTSEGEMSVPPGLSEIISIAGSGGHNFA